MEFTALQLSGTDNSESVNHASKATLPEAAEEIARNEESQSETKKKDPDAKFTKSKHNSIDTEKGVSTTAKMGRKWEAELKMLTSMTETSVQLLYLSCIMLFVAIFTFIWANQPRSVAIAVTVVFCALCVRPLAIFLSMIL